MVKIGFSAPAADHGWIAAITNNVKQIATQLPDVEMHVVEGTNDVNLQISQVETFINDKVDAIVLLPFDGAQMTDVARKAMDAGIVGGQRATGSSARTSPTAPTSAATTTAWASRPAPTSATAEGQGRQQPGDRRDPGHRLAAADPGPVEGLRGCLAAVRFQGDQPGLCGVHRRLGRTRSTANLLQAAPKIDAIWNHDDDQGVGVLAAIQSAGRSEFFMVGGAGSANVMRDIKADNTVLKATVIYPSTQSASAVLLARLLVLDKGMGDLKEPEVPKSITLYAQW